MNVKFRFVCASRESADAFLEKTALGRSLSTYLRIPNIELRLFPDNRLGLPRVYNEALREAARNPAILMFIHDDVHLCDFFWPVHIINGLRTFDVIGLAGNKRRVPRQPSWYYLDDQFHRDDSQFLSGVVAHGKSYPPENVSMYGAPCQEVKLLDGLLLATRSETLLSKGIEFDERFDFHFYDLDFCRQAESKRLRMGTWTVSVIHQSGGAFGTPLWQAGYAKYLEKWQS